MTIITIFSKAMVQLIRQTSNFYFIFKRWVASSFRTVKAVYDDLEPLYLHFKEASSSSKWTKNDNAMFTGMLTRIQSVEFIVDLG